MEGLVLVCALFLGVYVWVVWVWFLKDSHHAMILAQNQYLQTLKQIQIENDNAFLNALERGH
jgi:predicted negative regulator of RcsB-dependent stress response